MQRKIRRPSPAMWLACGLGTALGLGGCVFQSTYNNMLQQQQALEASLRAEISADQVQIEQLKDGIRVRMSGDLLYPRGRRRAQPKRTRGARQGSPAAGPAAYEIDVVGNTDNLPIGPELAERYPTNWELAGARAAVVVRYLQAQGVDPSRDAGNLRRPVPSGGLQRHPARAGEEPQHRDPAAPALSTAARPALRVQRGPPQPSASGSAAEQQPTGDATGQDQVGGIDVADEQDDQYGHG